MKYRHILNRLAVKGFAAYAEEIREALALQDISLDYETYSATLFTDFLSGAFFWDETTQGAPYWKEMSNALAIHEQQGLKVGDE